MKKDISALQLAHQAATEALNDKLKQYDTKLQESRLNMDGEIKKIEGDMKEALKELKDTYEKRMSQMEKKRLATLERKVTFHDEKLKESESFANDINRRFSDKLEDISK